MVADDDKNGEEYNPEVSGVERPEEISEDEYSPVREEAPIVGVAAVQEKSSPLKKIGVAIVLIAAVFAIASYLTHKKKVRLAEQSETTAIVANTNAAPEPNNSSDSEKSDQDNKTKVVENKPADKPEVSVQAAASAPASLPAVVAQNKESPTKTRKTEAVSSMSSKDLEESAAKMAMAAEASMAPKTESSIATTTAAPATRSVPAEETSAKPVVAQVPGDVDKQISSLKDQVKSNENKFTDLNARVSSLDNAISKFNNSISTLDKKIGDMTVVSKAEKKPVTHEKVVTQKRPLHKVAIEPNRPKHNMMNMGMSAVGNTSVQSRDENFDKIAYTVKAIVPGRAWIESPNGYKFSVSVGDRVLGYGTVTQINADYGEVIFDGGDVIKYGYDDH